MTNITQEQEEQLRVLKNELQAAESAYEQFQHEHFIKTNPKMPIYSSYLYQQPGMTAPATTASLTRGQMIEMKRLEDDLRTTQRAYNSFLENLK